jgi:hypothetical protein
MYDPTTGRFLSLDPTSANGVDILFEHPFIYARNNPVNRIDPSGRQAGEKDAPARDCTALELKCIDTAKKLAVDILKRNRDTCFSLISRLCGRKCSTEELTDCILAALERTTYKCEEPEYCHGDSLGRTEGLCAWFKSLAALGQNLIFCSPFQAPCTSPVPNANNCSLCLEKSPIFAFLCKRRLGRGGIDNYCPNHIRELANILVHEASHNCVGGHGTTNPRNDPEQEITPDKPHCDPCGRPDSYAIEKSFLLCK